MSTLVEKKWKTIYNPLTWACLNNVGNSHILEYSAGITRSELALELKNVLLSGKNTSSKEILLAW